MARAAFFKWMGFCCMALVLAACDGERVRALEEGVATEADVRREFGEPEAIWDGPDGGRVFEYNRQPAGQRNYQITIGTDGKMTSLRQVLTVATFVHVLPGMPMEEVRKMLGKPAKITPYDLKKEVDYDWRYVERDNVPMVFTVTFDRNLQVVRTASTPDPAGEAQRGS